MATTNEQPKSFEEWIRSAPIKELVQGLYDRIGVLQADKDALELRVKTQDEKIKSLSMSVISHKHAKETGECTIPAGVVIPVG